MPLDPDDYRALVEHAPTMVWRAGPDGGRTYFNATWLAFTGRTLDQELGTGWIDSVHPDDVERCLLRLRESVDHQQPLKMAVRLRRHDGSYRRVVDRGVPYLRADGSLAGYAGTCIAFDDIGDAAVSEAVELFEMSLDNLCVAGFDGYLKRVNPSWTRTLGWTPDELMAQPSIELVHPDDRASVLAARRTLADDVPLRSLVNRYRCRDGSYRWLEWRSVAHLDRGVVYAAARDVTEQKENQRALHQLTESLTTMLNSIADGVIATDATGAVVRMNPVAEKLTGWNADDAAGRPLGQVFTILDAATRAPAALPLELTLDESIAVEISRHTLLVARTGVEVPIASSCAPMRTGDGSVSGVVLVFRDMTADLEAREVRDQLQRQLVFADRMASVGTLAAGVAHEINNPLAYIMGNLDMMVEELAVAVAPLPGQIIEWADMARDAKDGAERIRRIVRGLKTLAHDHDERVVVIEVVPVLEIAINLASNELRHRARLVKDFRPVPLVAADDARLSQVFINLLVNAAHAVGDAGAASHEIRIATSTDRAGRAVIEISDTGPGIPDAVIGRVFEPFFTTKAIGVGTGLGLWVCHNIIASMGGEITATNHAGRGAVFRVVLPPAGRPNLDRVRPTATGPLPARPATVLVVDDDPVVGMSLSRVLRHHQVTVVTTARHALAILASGVRFDVILSDLMMPGMSGMDLHDEVARLDPDAVRRMVFVTGGAFTPAAAAFLGRIDNERIDKPFDPAQIRQLVERFAGGGGG